MPPFTSNAGKPLLVKEVPLLTYLINKQPARSLCGHDVGSVTEDWVDPGGSGHSSCCPVAVAIAGVRPYSCHQCRHHQHHRHQHPEKRIGIYVVSLNTLGGKINNSLTDSDRLDEQASTEYHCKSTGVL